MKKVYHNSYTGLVFLHLLLLIYPLASKSVHVHHGELSHLESDRLLAIGVQDELCPICNFEFYSFDNVQFSVPEFDHKCLTVNNSPEQKLYFPADLKYFSLRAPPQALS